MERIRQSIVPRQWDYIATTVNSVHAIVGSLRDFHSISSLRQTHFLTPGLQNCEQDSLIPELQDYTGACSINSTGNSGSTFGSIHLLGTLEFSALGTHAERIAFPEINELQSSLPWDRNLEANALAEHLVNFRIPGTDTFRKFSSWKRVLEMIAFLRHVTSSYHFERADNIQWRNRPPDYVKKRNTTESDQPGINRKKLTRIKIRKHRPEQTRKRTKIRLHRLEFTRNQTRIRRYRPKYSRKRISLKLHQEEHEEDNLANIFPFM